MPVFQLEHGLVCLSIHLSPLIAALSGLLCGCTRRGTSTEEDEMASEKRAEEEKAPGKATL